MAKGIEMAPEQFWDVIASKVIVTEDGGIDARPVVDYLKTLPPAEILAFDRRCSRYYAESRTWPLWGAASVIHNGAPDDTFDYFRSWLIGRGREVYEAAMKDPDSLADVATREAIDDLLYCAGQVAYESVTRAEMPKSEIAWPDLVQDIDFNDAPSMARLYPRLSKKFGEYYSQFE